MTAAFQFRDRLEGHAPALLRYAYSRLQDKDVAQDVVQETLLAAWRGHHAFVGMSSERTWLIGILKHRLADHWRKRRRLEHLMESLDSPGDMDAVPFMRTTATWQSGTPAPDAELEQQQFWQIIADCIATLPPAQARAFRLCELEGLDTNEICAILNVAPAALWVTLHRARHRMRAQLQQRWMFSDAAQ